MQIGIIEGVYVGDNSDYRVSLPRNMIATAESNGVSNGYLRPMYGIVELTDDISGVDRGAWNWNGVCYRVVGTDLVRINEVGIVTVIGTIPGSDEVVFDQSFDRLAVCADERLFYYSGGSITEVTDPDLGACKDMIWVDGYFMTTDGEYLVVTELNSPTTIDALKYGSSEADPDPVISLLKIHKEPVVLNRYTVEYFENVGGDLFPFAPITGAQLSRGAIGRDACCVFMDSVVFLGSGRNESPAVWIGSSGTLVKMSTEEIDKRLLSYTEEQLSTAVIEEIIFGGSNKIILRLPDISYIYDKTVSEKFEQPVWIEASSCYDVSAFEVYLAKNWLWCYNKYIVGHPIEAKIGYISDTITSHWGQTVGWDFDTLILYNEGAGAIVRELELVGSKGTPDFEIESTVWTSYTLDGNTWSIEKPMVVGHGDRRKRLKWFKQGIMDNMRIQNFRGDSNSKLRIMRLEATLEGLGN